MEFLNIPRIEWKQKSQKMHAENVSVLQCTQEVPWDSF